MDVLARRPRRRSYRRHVDDHPARASTVGPHPFCCFLQTIKGPKHVGRESPGKGIPRQVGERAGATDHARIVDQAPDWSEFVVAGRKHRSDGGPIGDIGADRDSASTRSLAPRGGLGRSSRIAVIVDAYGVADLGEGHRRRGAYALACASHKNGLGDRHIAVYIASIPPVATRNDETRGFAVSASIGLPSEAWCANRATSETHNAPQTRALSRSLAKRLQLVWEAVVVSGGEGGFGPPRPTMPFHGSETALTPREPRFGSLDCVRLLLILAHLWRRRLGTPLGTLTLGSV